MRVSDEPDNSKRGRVHSSTARYHFATPEERDAYFAEIQATARHLDELWERLAPEVKPNDWPDWLVATGDQYVEPATKKLKDL